MPFFSARTALLFQCILNFAGYSWAFHHCSPENGGGICPDHDTCCPTSIPGLSACISVKQREHGACCSDDNDDGIIGLTGCGHGYACKKNSVATEQPSVKALSEQTSTSPYFCERIDPHYNGTKPMPPILPRYNLLPVTPLLINQVYGLPVREIEQQGSNDTLEEKPHHLAYFSNMESLESQDPAILARHANVKTAIITVHGSSTNADDYLVQTMASLPTQEQNHTNSSMLVLAPWFLDPHDNLDYLAWYEHYIRRHPNSTILPWEEGEDPNSDDSNQTTTEQPQYRLNQAVQLPPKTLKWWDAHGPPTLHHPWRYGANAINTSISSFAAVDALVERLVSDAVRFPNLRRILAIGHSAGGQFTHRWALLSNIPAWVVDNITIPEVEPSSAQQQPQNSQRSVAIEVVPANPRCFAFLDERRYFHSNDIFDTEDYESFNQHHPLEVPNATVVSGCPEYNEWLFGLNPGNYVDVPYKDAAIGKAGGAKTMAHRYVAQRDVQYLAGALDEQVFDDGCASVYQGPTRRARSYHFMSSLQALYGSENTHRRFLVQGVHHDHALIYQSPEGQRVLFGDCGTDLDQE